MDTIAKAIAEYDEEHAFARQLMLPEEDRARYLTKWQGGYRWFRSPDVIPLEKYRRLRSSREDRPADAAE